VFEVREFVVLMVVQKVKVRRLVEVPLRINRCIMTTAPKLKW
jgi:hypothetical protein